MAWRLRLSQAVSLGSKWMVIDPIKVLGLKVLLDMFMHQRKQKQLAAADGEKDPTEEEHDSDRPPDSTESDTPGGPARRAPSVRAAGMSAWLAGSLKKVDCSNHANLAAVGWVPWFPDRHFV